MQGLEGVIAKKLGSTYRPGKRTKDWLKVKNRRRVDVDDRRLHRGRRQPIGHVRRPARRAADRR